MSNLEQQENSRRDLDSKCYYSERSFDEEGNKEVSNYLWYILCLRTQSCSMLVARCGKFEQQLCNSKFRISVPKADQSGNKGYQCNLCHGIRLHKTDPAEAGSPKAGGFDE